MLRHQGAHRAPQQEAGNPFSFTIYIIVLRYGDADCHVAKAPRNDAPAVRSGSIFVYSGVLTRVDGETSFRVDVGIDPYGECSGAFVGGDAHIAPSILCSVGMTAVF